MKALTILFFLCISATAYAQNLFHEDFENPDSVVSSGSIGFAQCTRIAAGGNACDSSSYGVGDSCYLTTIPFSTVGNYTVLLSFDQIAKIEFIDRAIVEVSNDNGLTWTQLTSPQYLGQSNFATQGNKFAEASYPTWAPGDTITLCNNSWWKHELFDIGSLVGNSPNVMIRFKLSDLNNNGMHGRTGWYIDNIKVGESYFAVANYGAYMPVFTPCNVPQLYVFNTAIMQSGYSYNDSVPVYIDFGDGTDTNFYAHPDTLNFNTNIVVQHYYPQNGSYNVSQTITDLLGTVFNYIDTLVLDSSTCGNITGKVYYDNNSNCVFDAGDVPVTHARLDVNSNSGNTYMSGYTDLNGDYIMNASYPLPYHLSLASTPFVSTIICPASNPVILNSVPSYTNDFAVTCSPGFDGYVNGYLWGMRLIQPVIINANVNNNYCQIDSGYLKVVLDNKLNFASATPAGYILNGDTAIWNNAIFPSGTNYIINAFKKPTVVLGDTICITYIAETLPSDLNPANNVQTVCRVVTNSYDPNFKEVSPTYEIDTNTTLDYTIHFQNTGNDTAFKVIITDTLDSNLDLSTLTINGGSHNFSTNVYPNNLLVFTFDPIQLPDSGHNQIESNGFVSYSIKLKSGTAVGTHIRNNSYIFFDANQPVITNTTDNVIVIPNAIQEVTNENQISVFPNPTSNHVVIKSNKPIEKIKVLNLLGASVYTSNGNLKNEITIPLSNLSKGIYTLIIESENKIIARKILKM